MTLIKSLPLGENKLKVMFEIYAEGEDYLRNIEKKTGINPSLAHRILKSLKEAGVISKKVKGKEAYYAFTKEGKGQFTHLLESFHLEMAAERSKDIKTFLKLLLNSRGIVSLCQKVYLFGSFAFGEVKEGSDIDVLFVTNNRKEILAWCRETSLALGRDISPLIYTPAKFRSELKKKEPLLDSIINTIRYRAVIK
ncbi:nucleotidyltransferase domain-containing protein [Candidatus Woesearchaeota archaeon]|nr:nucleotidyltransferase domain-containing protein [Candidatus Woesearchaeota archaeon]